MPKESTWGGRPPHVSIISDNPETLDGLNAYLARAGVPSSGARTLRNAAKAAPAAATAAVIFPDDFAEEEILPFLRELHGARPGLLLLIVTRDPQRFRAMTGADGNPLSAIVLPKPTFGWDIMDAIRAHAGGSVEGSS